MPNPRGELAGVLMSLFTDAELRHFIASRSTRGELERSLPGVGVSLEELAWGAAGLLERRGLIDDSLVQDLADLSGSHFKEISGFASTFGLGLPRPAAAAMPVVTPGMEVDPYDLLLSLTEGQFAELTVRLAVPPAHRPPRTLAMAERATVIMDWISQAPDGVTRLEKALRKVAPQAFSAAT